MLPGFLSVSDWPIHCFDATFHKVGLQLSGPGYAADIPAGSNSNPARVKRDAKSIAYKKKCTRLGYGTISSLARCLEPNGEWIYVVHTHYLPFGIRTSQAFIWPEHFLIFGS